ncbi:hypothetical protein PRZ48_009309 [Zasmidium cellare]|uniref:BTB domain-containing protein n=1 Tax=Zasmidium cellare TaxID=395010 RepID=A0ABR0EBD2_ZASCE|nr:hypothetical protein PRZ48_009309 [Zasmidium cellare]
MAATPDGTVMSTPPQAALPVISALAGYHNKSDLTDIDILDAFGTSYSVHRLILSLHSSRLAEMCTKIRPGGSIDLRSKAKGDYFPIHIEALTCFMYKFDYDVPWQEPDDLVGTGDEMIPAFHAHMASLGEDLGIAALATLATTKFQNVLADTEMTVQTFIKLARLTFDDPIPLREIRVSFITYVRDHSNLGITIYIGAPQLLLSVSVADENGVRRRLHTLALASNSSPEECKAKEPYSCSQCFTDQWRDDIQSLLELYACESCGQEASGWDWGVQATEQRQLKKRMHMEEGQQFTCPGCDENQMRRDIENCNKMYECDYCGWEEAGRVWFMVKELGEDF